MDQTAWAFYLEYAKSDVWWETQWLGRITCKCPLDLWIYQEILFRTRPDVIIETGTFHGGSALYLASLCDLIGTGRVVTIDIRQWGRRREHPRIRYLRGSSTDPEIVDQVKAEIADAERVMAILDSDHHKDHVLDELQAYGPLVTEDCYMVVEDTTTGQMISGFPGPAEAIEEFLESEKSFVVDRGCEKFLMTFNPGGYLRRAPGSDGHQTNGI
jgi:cephalosporin hydroxylase